jgi:hypothetical protein
MAAGPYVSLLAAAVRLAMFGTSRDAESYSASRRHAYSSDLRSSRDNRANACPRVEWIKCCLVPFKNA